MPERVGWGMGTQVLADRPNVLRAVLGRGPNAAPDGAGSATHVVVEANIDDMTGELAGHALSALLEAGALDAWLTPIQMKKGRPGHHSRRCAPISAADRLGRRAAARNQQPRLPQASPVSRGERPRRIVDVETPFGTVPVKVSTGPWGARSSSPSSTSARRAPKNTASPCAKWCKPH